MADLDRATQGFGPDGEHQQHVPRHHLLAAPRAVLRRDDGAVVELLAVEVADHVTLTLSATGPAAEAAAERYRTAVDTWAARVRTARDAGVPGPPEKPPRRPADDLAELTAELGDDVGTRYRWVTAMAGHEDDPWRFVRELRPAPPSHARLLRVRFGDGEEIELDLPPEDGR